MFVAVTITVTVIISVAVAARVCDAGTAVATPLRGRCLRLRRGLLTPTLALHLLVCWVSRGYTAGAFAERTYSLKVNAGMVLDLQGIARAYVARDRLPIALAVDPLHHIHTRSTTQMTAIATRVSE